MRGREETRKFVRDGRQRWRLALDMHNVSIPSPDESCLYGSYLLYSTYTAAVYHLHKRSFPSPNFDLNMFGFLCVMSNSDQAEAETSS